MLWWLVVGNRRSLNGGDELAVVEEGSEDAAMTSFTEKVVGREAMGGRLELRVGEVSYLIGTLGGFGSMVLLLVAVPVGSYSRICIAREIIAHELS